MYVPLAHPPVHPRVGAVGTGQGTVSTIRAWGVVGADGVDRSRQATLIDCRTDWLPPPAVSGQNILPFRCRVLRERQATTYPLYKTYPHGRNKSFPRFSFIRHNVGPDDGFALSATGDVRKTSFRGSHDMSAVRVGQILAKPGFVVGDDANELRELLSTVS